MAMFGSHALLQNKNRMKHLYWYHDATKDVQIKQAEQNNYVF